MSEEEKLQVGEPHEVPSKHNFSNQQAWVG